MERKLVLESCWAGDSWGLLDMYVLLTDDIVEFGMGSGLIDLARKQELTWSPATDIKLNHKQHEELVVSLLISRCPVSICNIFFLRTLLFLCKTWNNP